MSQQPQPRISFDQILLEADLPNPGPEYYQARRRLWLTQRVNPTPPPPSTARDKLEDILRQPNAIESLDAWTNGLERVWNGLSSGGKLKNRLPMNLIIKVVQASWIRDRTWPAGMVVASTDDEKDMDAPTTDAPPTPNTQECPPAMPSISVSEVVETPSPWLMNNRNNRGR